MTQIFSILLTIFKAIPALKSAWDGLVSLYIEHEIASIRKERREAIRKAINEQDQRDIEKAIGSDKAGKESGIPGTVIVDDGDLPDVKRL